MQLNGKRIVVTGGARGIGAGTVRAYVREGAVVASLDVLDEPGKSVVQEINAQGAGRAIYYHCDISSADEVSGVFQKAAAEMGGIDVLAQIAGVESFKRPAEEYTPQDMNLIWNVNISGTVLTNQAACRLMQEQRKGVIINFASDVALTGMPNGGLYAASKGAVLSWTRTIAYEWAARYNIRCNCVNPTINTPMYEEWLSRLSPEDLKAHLAAERLRVPLGGSMGDVDRDMAPVMVFLASDGSGFINGQIICVNGGRNMLRG